MPCLSEIYKLRDIVARSRLKPRGATSLPEPQQRNDNDDDEMWQIIIDPQHDGYGSRSCRDRELWHARQAFLTSYHFSVDERSGTRHRLQRSIKEAHIVAVEVGSRFGRIVRDRWVGFKMTRVVSFRRATISVLRCFIPNLARHEVE